MASQLFVEIFQGEKNEEIQMTTITKQSTPAQENIVVHHPIQ